MPSSLSTNDDDKTSANIVFAEKISRHSLGLSGSLFKNALCAGPVRRKDYISLRLVLIDPLS